MQKRKQQQQQQQNNKISPFPRVLQQTAGRKSIITQLILTQLRLLKTAISLHIF